MTARRTLIALGALVTTTAAVLTHVAPGGQPPDHDGPAEIEPRYAADELLVRFRHGASADQRLALTHEVGGTSASHVPGTRATKIELEDGVSVQDAVASLERRPDVVYAEPNFYYRPVGAPNDPGFRKQWGLLNSGQMVTGRRGRVDADIDAPAAWRLALGNRRVRVAVIDTGVAYDHPDLARNIWRNRGETGRRATNGVDDDHNGYVDDSRGWDFVRDRNAPFDVDGHGTHVAATIGARRNNAAGIAGIAPRVTIMPLRVGARFVDSATAATAIAYAADNGADIVNVSLAADLSGSRTLEDALVRARNVLFVTAAGNGPPGVRGTDNDGRPHVPCNSRARNLICVAATDQSDRIARYSNYGRRSVDIAAPGRSILAGAPSLRAIRYTFETRQGWTSQPKGSWGTYADRLSDSPGASYGLDCPPGDVHGPPCIRSSVRSPRLPLNTSRACVATFDLRLDFGAYDDLWVEAARGRGGRWTNLEHYDGITGAYDEENRRTAILDLPRGARYVRLRWRSQNGGQSDNSPPPPDNYPFNGKREYYDGVNLDDVAIRCSYADYSRPEKAYLYRNGSSFAAPHVAGVAALYLARYPRATPLEVKRAILQGGDAKRGLRGKVASGSGLNALKTLKIKP